MIFLKRFCHVRFKAIWIELFSVNWTELNANSRFNEPQRSEWQRATAREEIFKLVASCLHGLMAISAANRLWLWLILLNGIRAPFILVRMTLVRLDATWLAVSIALFTFGIHTSRELWIYVWHVALLLLLSFRNLFIKKKGGRHSFPTQDSEMEQVRGRWDWAANGHVPHRREWKSFKTACAHLLFILW